MSTTPVPEPPDVSPAPGSPSLPTVPTMPTTIATAPVFSPTMTITSSDCLSVQFNGSGFDPSQLVQFSFGMQPPAGAYPNADGTISKELHRSPEQAATEGDDTGSAHVFSIDWHAVGPVAACDVTTSTTAPAIPTNGPASSRDVATAPVQAPVVTVRPDNGPTWLTGPTTALPATGVDPVGLLIAGSIGVLLGVAARRLSRR